jgi:hypothetical protein
LVLQKDGRGQRADAPLVLPFRRVFHSRSRVPRSVM